MGSASKGMDGKMTLEEFIEKNMNEIIESNPNMSLHKYGGLGGGPFTFALEEKMPSGRRNSVQITQDLSELVIFHDAILEEDGVAHTVPIYIVNSNRKMLNIWDVKDHLKEEILSCLDHARTLDLTDSRSEIPLIEVSGEEDSEEEY